MVVGEMSNNPNIPSQSSSQPQKAPVSSPGPPPPKPPTASLQPPIAAKPATTAQPAPLKPSFEGEGWRPLPKKLKIFGNLLSEVVNKGICMYGGAGTALLLYALDQKIIDYAVVSGYSFKDPYRPEPQIASTREDLIKTAGSRYTPGGQVGGLGEIAIPNRGSTNSQEERLAVVGLPCELQGMWRMTTHWIATPKLAKNVVFTMGLFCSKVFDYQKMMVDYVQGKRGIDLRTITKVNVKKARLLVYVGEKLVIDEPVEAVAFSAREECNVCIDYSAELADIAIGAIGSATGWTTILTRTPRGEEIVNGAAKAGYLELKPISEKGLKFVEKLCMMKRRRDPSVYMRNETSVPKPEPSLVALEIPVK